MNPEQRMVEILNGIRPQLYELWNLFSSLDFTQKELRERMGNTILGILLTS